MCESRRPAAGAVERQVSPHFSAHSLKSLERNILKFAGIGPIRQTLIGGVEAIGDAKRKAWLDSLSRLGRDAK